MSEVSKDGPVTEIVKIYLREGVKIEEVVEGVGQFGRIWRESLQTASAQKGYTGSYYGGTLEDEGVLVWCIDWEALIHHQNFIESPVYPSFLANLGPILQSAEIIHVGRLNVSGAVAKEGRKGGVMEVATFYDVEDVFVEGAKNFIKAAHTLDAEKKIAGFLGTIDYGEVHEKIAKNKEAEEEEKGRALVLMVGWESRDAHLAFRETQEFADIIGYLRKGTSGAGMFHVAFKGA